MVLIIANFVESTVMDANFIRYFIDFMFKDAEELFPVIDFKYQFTRVLIRYFKPFIMFTFKAN